jgi:hypothetical protein
MPIPADPRQRCEHCRFFDPPNPGDEEGWCLRYPPQIFCVSPTHPVGSFFPKVGPQDWCGEFQPDGQ